MFAIAFDMVVSDLEKYYGQPYNNAYFEIGKVLRKYEFYNAQGSVYLTPCSDFSNMFRAMNTLKNIGWFRLSVRDIRAFRVENWSDFTGYMKEE